MKKPAIYRAWIGDRFYFGQTLDPKQRAAGHLSLLRRSKHNNMHMQRAFNKHQCFYFEVLVYVPADDLDAVEQALIDAHVSDRACMNIARDATAPGRSPSAETRAKMSNSHKGKVQSPEQRAKNSAALTGRIYSAEHRANIGAARTGKKHRPESCAKISAANRKRKMSAACRAAIAKANNGRKCTPEQRARMSEAQKKRFANTKKEST
jgi:group I intron endonuclease